MRDPTEAVAPVSAMTRGTSSSFLARMAAAAAFSSASRSSTGVAAQDGKALASRGAGGVGVGDRGVGRLPHHLLGGRVDDVVGPVAGLDPLPPDQQLCFVPGDLTPHGGSPFTVIDDSRGAPIGPVPACPGHWCRGR